MSGSHYVKPAGRTYGPSAVLSLVVDPIELPTTGPVKAQPLGFGRAAACLSVYRRGRWTKPVRQSFDRPTEVVPWIEQQAPERVRLQVVAPLASNALTLCGAWPLFTARGAVWERGTGIEGAGKRVKVPRHLMAFTRLVARGRPDIIAYRYHGKSYCWVSGTQYFLCGEADLARSIGWTPPGSGDATEPGLPPDGTCEARADLWLAAVCHLAEWWRRIDGGPWGQTVGQLAEHYFRARIAPRTVVVHNDQYTRALEAKAIFGGRASTFFFGDIGYDRTALPGEPTRPPPSPYYPEPGPAYHLDVRSMYPWLLATRDFPVRRIAHRERPTVPEVQGLLGSYCVIASVLLNARHGEYPYRSGDRVLYPTGRFATALAGPELERAIAGGEVEQVVSAAVYQRGRPFSRMASELLDLRKEARERGQPGWDLFVKMLSNSFAGKLAQRAGRWCEAPDVPAERDWGEWYTIDRRTGERRRFRSALGLVWEHREEERSGRPLGFAFAYLTAYGRALMRQAREACPVGSVYSQDTDGLWCSSEAVTAVKGSGLPFGDEPGNWRLTSQEPALRFYGPKHYWSPSGWTLAGIHSVQTISDALTFLDSFAVNPLAGAPSSAPRVCFGVRRQVTLSCLPQDCAVTPSGWAVPIHIGSGL